MTVSSVYLDQVQDTSVVCNNNAIQGAAVMTCVALAMQTVVNAISNVSSERTVAAASNSPFNSDVPKTYAEIRIKLERMIQYMISHPDDIQTAKVFFAFLENLETQGIFAQHPELADILAKSTGTNGLTIYAELVDLLVQYHFYETGDVSNAFLEEIRSKFSGDDRIAKEIRARIDAIENGTAWKTSSGQFITWQQWADESKKSWTSESIHAWDWIAGNSWGNFLIEDGSQISHLTKDLRMSVIDGIINDPAYKDNAYLLIMIIFCMLNDDTSCSEISGYASMGEYFSDRTKDISKILDIWKNPPTIDPGFTFFKSIEDFKFKIDNSPYVSSEMKERIDAQIKEIEDIKYEDHGEQGPTWISLYQTACGTGAAADAAKDRLNGNFIEVANNPYASTQAVFSTIDYKLKDISSSVADQSQVQTTEMTEVVNDSEVNLNLLEKAFKETIDLLSTIIRNQISR